MAYLKPKMTVFIANHKQPIYANVEKVAFRKYWGKKRDKDTGKMVRARRSMPLCHLQGAVVLRPEHSVGCRVHDCGLYAPKRGPQGREDACVRHSVRR